MIRKTLLTASVTFGLALTVSAPAEASWWGGGCKRNCGSTTTTTGGSTTGGTTTSGSTKVPEPGMLGLMGAGVIGLAIARRKRASKN